nr:unnamed protein product [Callosobruchus analis]
MTDYIRCTKKYDKFSVKGVDTTHIVDFPKWWPKFYKKIVFLMNQNTFRNERVNFNISKFSCFKYNSKLKVELEFFDIILQWPTTNSQYQEVDEWKLETCFFSLLAINKMTFNTINLTSHFFQPISEPGHLVMAHLIKGNQQLTQLLRVFINVSVISSDEVLV